MMNLINDPTLPDLLLPEEPLYDEVFQIDDLLKPTFHPDVAELSRKIESLTIEINIQGLRLEIERTKRQRLQATVRQLKRDITLSNSDIQLLRNEVTQLRDFQNSVNYQLDNDITRTNTLSFRSLTRICQILMTLAPSSTLPSETSPEVKILLRELDSTIRHFGVHYFPSNV